MCVQSRGHTLLIRQRMQSGAFQQDQHCWTLTCTHEKLASTWRRSALDQNEPRYIQILFCVLCVVDWNMASALVPQEIVYPMEAPWTARMLSATSAEICATPNATTGKQCKCLCKFNPGVSEHCNKYTKACINSARNGQHQNVSNVFARHGQRCRNFRASLSSVECHVSFISALKISAHSEYIAVIRS